MSIFPRASWCSPTRSEPSGPAFRFHAYLPRSQKLRGFFVPIRGSGARSRTLGGRSAHGAGTGVPLRGTWAAATGRRTGKPAFQAGDGRPHQNRGASAEAQCGAAPRAARDLPARPVPRKTAGAPGMERPESIPLGSPPRTARRGMEPCSPVNPFFLVGGLWLDKSGPLPRGNPACQRFWDDNPSVGFAASSLYTREPLRGAIRPCALPFALKAGKPRARNARPYKGTGRLTGGTYHALGGVPGRILASGGQKRFRAPAIFLWYRQAAPSLCSPLRAAQRGPLLME